MEITAETLSKNTKEYQIYDIRGEEDRLYWHNSGLIRGDGREYFFMPAGG